MDHGQYSFVTDKMPDNYERVGLILLLFPKARIIYCKHSPPDIAQAKPPLRNKGLEKCDITHNYDRYR